LRPAWLRAAIRVVSGGQDKVPEARARARDADGGGKAA
jgi:hypothetical protein